MQVSRASEIRLEAGKAAAFISLEGAHIIYCRTDLLEIAFSRGVRSLNIT